MNNPNEPYNNDQNNSYADDYLNNTVDIPTQSQSQYDQYGSQYPQAPKNTPNKTLIICLGIIGVTIVIILTALIVFALTGRSSGGNAGSSESGFVTNTTDQQDDAPAIPAATPIPTPSTPQVPSSGFVPSSNTTVVSTMYVSNVRHSIYFRSEPFENDANIISELPLGTPVGFIENYDNVFAKINYNGTIGYAKQEYLSYTQTTNEVTKTMYVANVNYSIYFRSSAQEIDSNIICEIPLGTAVGFISIEDSTFSKINYNGTIGYCKTQYLSDYAPRSNNTVVSTKYVANVQYSIYLRSTPNETDNNIICEIPVGTAVGFIENTNSTFAKINYNGTIGYSKRIYLEDSYSSGGSSSGSGSTMTVVNVQYAIYLRSTPDESSNSNIIMEIPVGAKVTYLGTPNNTFYKISYNGTVGYSKQIYLSW